MLSILREESGYSLIELIVVIVIVAILAAVGMKSMTAMNETVRVEETKAELEQLAHAVVGDPELMSGGGRTDFGYVGDVGSLPPNLDALVTNPGGLGTWDGPYIRDDFYTSAGGVSTEFKVDAWGTAYQYSGGASIISTGSGSTISRRLGNSVDDLLYNRVTITVTDLDNDPPGSIYRDSVRLVLAYPDGSGGTTNRAASPDANGLVVFDSIPIGQQILNTIYLPANDTLTRLVTVNPGDNSYIQTQLYADVW